MNRGITDVKTENNLLSLAAFLLAQFSEQPHLMNFLFFNPVAQSVLSNSNQNFSFFNTTMQLVHEIAQQHPNLSEENFFVQIWAFIQGYGLLIKNHVINYDPELIRDLLNHLLKE